MPISTSAFFREPFIQQALICTIKTAISIPDSQTIRPLSISSGFHQTHHAVEIFLSRGKDHDSRIETVGPSNIRASIEVLWKVEEMRDWTQWQDIGVEIDYFSEMLLQTEDVKLGQCRMQIRST